MRMLLLPHQSHWIGLSRMAFPESAHPTLSFTTAQAQSIDQSFGQPILCNPPSHIMLKCPFKQEIRLMKWWLTSSESKHELCDIFEKLAKARSSSTGTCRSSDKKASMPKGAWNLIFRHVKMGGSSVLNTIWLFTALKREGVKYLVLSLIWTLWNGNSLVRKIP